MTAQHPPGATDESAFVLMTDRLLEALGEALDESDGDFDWELRDGILTIDCGDGSKVIVNRHLPNREIWVAARSGGFHFSLAGGVWKDTRSSATLDELLRRVLREQGGVDVELPL